ncbi:hypothetical protein Sgleb_04560 [Streptomyces glebosus]|uniref:Uncharacterized protein n=1 Tax=Streptomyces glebosus TaxID=249580 RepID=A0A640SLS4_9ACTN|nr:hypothetical protein [Streptomyces glebosus]GFE12409.1 hypothetical protein Sgleb_04560 [Streptomyces glebosus]GHG82886.1 hypothetical protein GCM10010513_62110 [Streptomyces glebosus]
MMRIKRKILAGIAAASFTSIGLLGASASPAQAVTTAQHHSISSPSKQAAASKWTIRNSFFGKDGEDVPLRNGDESSGYKHIQDKHPIDDTSLIGWIDDTLEDGTYKKQGDKIVARNRTATGQMFRVVFTEREDSGSKDGRPVGVITAFLE